MNRYIQKINNSLKKKFDFQISKKNLQFIGNEQDIRFFFVQYFAEKTGFFEWPFDFVDEASLEKNSSRPLQVFELPTASYVSSR